MNNNFEHKHVFYLKLQHCEVYMHPKSGSVQTSLWFTNWQYVDVEMLLTINVEY